jgi:protocatechuate 3,4-dioxygenase beta subunit
MKRDATSGTGTESNGRFEGRRLHRPGEELVDQGLAFDLETLMDRRRLLRLFGVAGLGAGLLLVGCGPTAGAPSGAGTSAAGTASADGTCDVIPEETAGPYPGDGSNGPDVLGQSGIVRRDIRSSFGPFSGVAEGVPLTIELDIQDATNGCAPVMGAAAYVWHCDRDGAYSLYTVTDQNYLRGVQETSADGIVSFTSIFPACYPGRWPHVHFEVYPSLDAATDPANAVATSQIALPEAACVATYATPGYEQSVQTLSLVSLQSDMVFGDDGGAHQLGRVDGDPERGFTVALAVPVGA